MTSPAHRAMRRIAMAITGIAMAITMLTSAPHAHAGNYMFISPGTCGVATHVYQWQHSRLHHGARSHFSYGQWKYKVWEQQTSGNWVYTGYTRCTPAQ